jgi:hypothetical protein
MLKAKNRSAEYRGLAAQAAEAGANSPLDHVREKHERSAARWTELAEVDEAREADRERRLHPAA